MADLIKVENGEGLLDTKMAVSLIEITNKKKELEDLEKKYKEMIQKAMEENNVIKVVDEISGVTINYISERTDKEVFHKDKFQEEHPELYNSYITCNGKTKAYIKVTTK